MRLSGKVAVVTGASMGIGEAIARIFLEEGASVVFSSRDAARVEAARGRAGSSERSLAVTCDVRNREEIDRLLGLTLHNFGRCDIWVNNAGHGLMDTVEKLDLQQVRQLLETNLIGAIGGMQVAVPVMKQQGSGAIINVSSVAGYITVPGSGAYGATKSALNAIGRAAAMELKGTGVHVMTVCPGYIDTNFLANSVRGNDPRRLGASARRGSNVRGVAVATLEGYLKQKQVVVVPWKYQVLIWVYQLFPSLLENYMAKNLRPADEVMREAIGR
ncbi:MAG: SDR family NAD(P)-dependent oxidoreductase [Candidatus Korobacteraceae bacterium]